MLRIALIVISLVSVSVIGWAVAQSPSKPLSEDKKDKGNLPPEPGSTSTSTGARNDDVALVERAIAARREYENSLRALHAHYTKIGDKQRIQWAEQELMGFHMLFKPSYNLDVKDVPPANLIPRESIPQANELYRAAMSYKDRGFGDDYILNQRRAEILFREILEKYETSDKIAEVAYQLGELYEGKAYKQYDRAAKYFERSAQWVKGSRTDALMRAATIQDRELNDRTKAVELYRLAVSRDVDPDRIRQAERRLAELTGQRR